MSKMHFYCVSHGKTTLQSSPLHEITTNPIAYPSHFHNFNRMQASKAQKPLKWYPFLQKNIQWKKLQPSIKWIWSLNLDGDQARVVWFLILRGTLGHGSKTFKLFDGTFNPIWRMIFWILKTFKYDFSKQNWNLIQFKIKSSSISLHKTKTFFVCHISLFN
jgi:hypothetical protein